MSEQDQKTDTEALIRFVEQLHECKGVTVTDPRLGPATFVAVPRGMELKPIKPYLDAYLARPERVKGIAQILDLDSLVCHALRFKTAHSAAFAIDAPEPSLLVVYDYHEPSAGDFVEPDPEDDEASRAATEAANEACVTKGNADWCQHRARYQFPLSDEWTTWTGATGAMTQQLFAEFIEDNIADVVDPTVTGITKAREFAEALGIELAGPSKLMSLSRGLAVRVDTKVAQAVNLTSGEGQVIFEEQHQGAGGDQLKVPGGFAIAIPVFKNGVHYSIPVRLRYRVQNGRLAWWLALHNIDRILKHAVDEVVQMFAKDTGLPVLYGAPEA